MVVAAPEEKSAPDASVSESELQQCVRDQLRSSRVPQRILFRDALPYNEMGKLLRRVIRDEMADAVAA